jgi:hypothetical protein
VKQRRDKFQKMAERIVARSCGQWTSQLRDDIAAAMRRVDKAAFKRGINQEAYGHVPKKLVQKVSE